MGGILVTGANGQLGCELYRLFESSGTTPNVCYTDIAELDICNVDAVRRYVNDNNIGIIINCAAYTAVDKAEDNPEVAQRVNGEAPGILAAVAAEAGALLIHISTDYVFDGNGPLPYGEKDQTSPLSVYGRTKLEGENVIAASGCRYIIIRTSWLYSTYGGNFVKTILRLASEQDTINVVFDQIGSPTNATDLASAIGIIVDQNNNKKAGFNEKINSIYNFSNEGVCSWYDFATEIVSYSGLKCKVMPVTSEMFPTKAQRPAFSVLNKSKIKTAFGIEIPYWRTSLHSCIDNL
ncbi:MAG: dTDP-4-dehydrorhamnose reductase [Bacteroidales bacterium]